MTGRGEPANHPGAVQARPAERSGGTSGPVDAVASTPPDSLPEEAWLAALVSLPGMGPARLRRQLAARSPRELWEAIVTGDGSGPSQLAARWAHAARTLDVARWWAAHAEAGLRVLLPGGEGWPASLVEDPEPPCVLFVLGELTALSRPCVAVVGTRRCSSAGRSIATELGRDLAAAGVCVVSGLAVGIDAAAHRGVLEVGGAPVAVVGSGLDVVYPARQRPLWDQVAAQGGLLSEYPLGAPAERWHFPARNRIIAGLVSIVVVVESHADGGAMHTVESALERDRLVMAVPGPVRSPASAGTNGLLVSGAVPARDAADVLMALGLRTAVDGRPTIPDRLPAGDAGVVLDAVGWGPCSLEEIAQRCDAPLGPVAVHLATLVRDGWITQGPGWYERVR